MFRSCKKGGGRLTRFGQTKERGAFTLMEVVMSVALILMLFGGVLWTYVQTSYRAEWSGLSMAAQALSIQQIEQARSAVWDLAMGKNELTNLSLLNWTYDPVSGTGSGYSYNTLDLPVSGTNIVIATNFVTLKSYYFNGQTNPPVRLQMMIVNTVWPFTMLGRTSLFTNTTASYYAPDNRDDSSL